MKVRELNYTRPWLYKEQAEALFGGARFSFIEASTKSGKTVGSMVWLAEEAMKTRPEKHPNYWWVAPIYSQADIAFRRMRDALSLPPELLTINLAKMSLTLPNGATIWFKSGENPDGLYGENVWAGVIDEASRFKEEAWHAFRTTLSSTEGAARIIGNVRGRRNWFWRLARRAQAGEKGLSYHKITAHDAIRANVLSKEEVEDAQRLLPPDVFQELYMAEASEEGNNPFGYGAIQKCLRPLYSAPPECWGWDLAKSIDWTVGIGLDSLGNVCRFERFQKPWQETIDDIAIATGGVKALVDSTGVGDPILEALQRRGGQNFEGLVFTATSKQQLMEGLKIAIQRGEIGFPKGPISDELEAFEYAYTRTGVRYSVPEGMHDDCVMALGLAVKLHIHKASSGHIRVISRVRMASR